MVWVTKSLKVRKWNNMADILKEVAELQESYKKLVDEKKLSKKAMCDLCVPFRDKYNLTDLQALRIARREMEIPEMATLLKTTGE